MIRKSVRKLMQQIGQVEREKEEYKAQLLGARKQLEEAANLQNRCESKLSRLQKTLRSADEEKANLEAKLGQKQMAVQSLEDAFKLKTDDLNLLTDKYKSLESQLHSVFEQKNQLEVSALPQFIARSNLTESPLPRIASKRAARSRHVSNRKNVISKKKCLVLRVERPSWICSGLRSKATSSDFKWVCRTRRISCATCTSG